MSTTAPDLRISTYNPVVPTTDFPAQFPVFDNDDIKVFVDGEERDDFAVSATYSEGISTNAKAVFAVGVTGKVQVVGARDPRRTNRFSNGGPLPTRDINLALDTLESEVQEARRDIGQAMSVAYGETPPDITELLENIEDAVAAAEAAVGAANGQFRFGTEADFQAASIPSVIMFVQTTGYYAIGDGGGHVKKRIALPSEVKPWHKQSADGAWWQIAQGQEIYAEMFGARGDYDETDASGTDNADPINNALAFCPQVALRGGFYKHTKTITLERHRRLYAQVAGYSNSVIDEDYFDAPLAHAILVPRGLARVHVVEPMITECINSGGVLANQNAGELYTTSSGTRLNTYRIMDFTNKDAVGATQATQRLLSIAVRAKAGSSLERVSIRTTALDGRFNLTSADTNWGEQVDVGYMGENAFFASIRKSVIHGSFRDAAILLIPQDVPGDVPDYYPQTDRFMLDECFVEGHCGFAVRGADELLVSAVNASYIECKWFRSHRFAPTGSIRAGGVDYSYTSLTVSGDALRFGGLSSNPVTNGLTVGSVMLRTQDARSYGTGGVTITNSFLRSISHPSLRLSTDNFYTDRFEFSGRVFELSGLGVRGIHYNHTYVHGREDILGWVLNAQDFHLNDGWWECKSRNTPAGPGLDSCRLIALSTTELRARGIAGAVPSCAQNIKFTGWTGTGAPVDRRPAWRQSASGYGVFGNTVSDDAGYFQPGRGYDDSYSGPSSGPSSDAVLVHRTPRLRSSQHPYMFLGPTGTIRSSMDKADHWSWGFGFPTNADAPYAVNFVFGSQSIVNVDAGASGAKVGYRVQNSQGSVGFMVDTDGLGTITLGDANMLRVGTNVFRSASDNAHSCGSASYRWTQVFAATATIGTSDEDLKDDIASIEERMLDAWHNVKWVQFRFKEAKAEKGDEARLHFGLIAQRIKAVFEAQNLDAFTLGLLCYDEWEAEYEDVLEEVEVPTELDAFDSDGNPIKVIENVRQMVPTGKKRLIREAGSVYGLRYEECFAVEAAYQRRRLDRLEALLNN